MAAEQLSRHLQWATLACLLAALTACEVGPDYVKPPAPIPAAYKEAPKDWKPAQPRDAAARGPWWDVYNDPVLDGLMRQIDVSNQNLKSFEAAFRQATAIIREARAGYYPTVNANANITRSKTGSGSGSTSSSSSTIGQAHTRYELSASEASWEIDLWGKIGRLVESDIAAAQASAGDLASARLSAQAQLVSAYMQLRVSDALKRLLDAEVEAFTRSLQITQNRYRAGVAARADVASAQTQLESTRAQAINVGVQRAQFEHAIAVLIGKPPAEFAIAPAADTVPVPEIPVELPSALLERRPDIAAAERRMASANAQIGVAVAAYYPALTLSASTGYLGPAIARLIEAPNSFWSIGPQLAETLFDGGLRSAQVDVARASYDQSVATYRQTVLTGFQQVEDNLSTMRILAEQAGVQQGAVQAARDAERLTLNQYRAGTVDYTSVVTAQTVALNNEETALSILQSRLTASVALIQALGGGWEVSDLPVDNEALEHQAATTPEEKERPAWVRWISRNLPW